ncbi:MAG: AAA family ATPase [Chloroflexi bacterium]|nr:AAA family ATPase [Chloroflexota bacterium]
MAARWLAYRLHYPLLTLDLSAVMSSFLGKTGNNIRVVLDYARRSQCILLLDEFDAIAKRRDDAAEVGELKRLVTVLLQEIDSWPPYGLLVAATNHPDLLDPAVWRRFDRVVEFVFPTRQEVQVLLTSLLPSSEIAESFVVLLSHILDGASFADVTKTLSAAKRYALVRRSKLDEALLEVAMAIGNDRSHREKLALAAVMQDYGLSQRRISTLIGVSRDTIRSHASGAQLDPSKRSGQRGNDAAR